MGTNSKLFINTIKTQRLYFDGAMGTVLLKKGVSATDETISEIHREYVDAGCNIVTTNTFNVNKNNTPDLEEKVKKSIEIARNAGGDKANTFTAFDMSPLGKLIEPLGDVSYADAVEYFSASALLAEKYGADVILIETMTDLSEACAAVEAAKRTTLPVLATCAFSENGRLLTGATPYDVVSKLEALGVCAVGVNCSYGPDKMLPVIEQLLKYASVPVIVNPNAGLPEIKNGDSVYNIGPDEFSDYMVKIASMGAGILGGCCGTTPEHIAKTVEKTKDLPYTYPTAKNLDLMEDDFKSETVSYSTEHPLIAAIIEGETEDAVSETEKLIKSMAPLEIINGYIVPALNEVGEGFGRGDLFLSELIMSAETASEAFAVIKASLPIGEGGLKGEIIIATVKGDVHDIGKNIVKILLESYGYKIYDLGIDVSPETVVKAVADTGCKLVGLSALMTTTIPAMEETIKLLHEADPEVRVIAGSAVLNPSSASEIGADYYAKDAASAVTHLESFYKNK